MSEEENKTGTEEQPKAEVKEEVKTEGKQFVEFTPEQEARFKRVYGHMKEYERELKKVSENNGILLSKLEEMESKFSSRETTDALAILKAEKKAAYESGNIDKVMEIDDKIIRLSTAPKPEKIELKKTDPKEVASEWLTPERKAVLDAWAQEPDQSGTPLRPWTNPNHPKYARLVEMAAGVMNDPDFKDGPIENVLQEVDRLMGLDKPKAVRQTAAVLGGDTNASPATDKSAPLTEAQKRTARLMFPKEKDPFKKYSEAMKKYGLRT